MDALADDFNRSPHLMQTITPLIFIVVSTGLSGCMPDDRCGGAYELDPSRGCVKVAVDQVTDTSIDDGDVAHGEVLTDMSDADDLSSLGRPCTDHDGCSGLALACVIMPGDTEGYCSIPSCTLEPDDCPEGYFCFDATQVGQSATICLKR